jgi:hypothetical protein
LINELPTLDPATNPRHVKYSGKTASIFDFGQSQEYVDQYVALVAPKLDTDSDRFMESLARMMPNIDNYYSIQFEIIEGENPIKSISLSNIDDMLSGEKTMLVLNKTLNKNKAFIGLKEGDIIELRSGNKSVLVKITRPYGRLIKDSELHKFNAVRAKPVETPRLSPEEVTLHSGGAVGADTD